MHARVTGRRLLVVAFALLALGNLTLPASDAARLTGWPALGVLSGVDGVAVLAAFLLLVWALRRPDVPRAEKLAIGTAFGFVLAMHAWGVAQRLLDGSVHDSVVASLAPVALAGAAMVSLAWNRLAARLLALAGATLFLVRQVLVWRSSDAMREALGQQAPTAHAEALFAGALAMGILAGLAFAGAFAWRARAASTA